MTDFRGFPGIGDHQSGADRVKIRFQETPDIRDLIVDDYIVRYYVDPKNEIIYILKIWHGRENER